MKRLLSGTMDANDNAVVAKATVTHRDQCSTTLLDC